MTFTPKPSKATQWWLGILAAVLVVLFIETKWHQEGSGSNLIITTDANVQGAEVFLDGAKAGVIGKPSDKGAVAGGVFWGYLSRGKHSIELRKPGFQSFSKKIEMHGEEFLAVDLKPEKN